MKVFRTLAAFLHKNDRGQDVAEYCLLTALIALIALGVFLHFSGGMQGMWNSANSSLAAGNSTAGPGTGISGN